LTFLAHLTQDTLVSFCDVGIQVFANFYSKCFNYLHK